MINLTFFKSPYHGEFKCAKMFSKFSKIKFVFKDNENVQILFLGIFAKIFEQFFAKNVHPTSFCIWRFK